MPTLVRAVIGYLFLLLMVRVLARRPGAQMTPFEFVLIFLIGGIIILATVGDDPSMINCYGGVIMICFMHRLVGYIKLKSSRLGMLIDGTPIVLINRGEMQPKSLEQARLAPDDIMAAARTKQVKTLDQIKYAVLERNGGISIIKRKAQ